MNLSEWRKLRDEGEEAQLPSGLEVRLRRVAIMDLAREGRIPQTMESQVDRAIKAQQGPVALTLHDIVEFGDLVNLVAAACIVAPTDLSVDELPYNDRLAIFQWANEAAESIRLFRQQAKEPVGIAPDGASVRAAAKRISRAGAG